MSANVEKELREERKVKALEKIATSLDGLSLWFEEIDKEEWNDRIQYYLSEFAKVVPKDEDAT
jgi:hypothetical protein|tara:strand:+ start:184 stop:372 length:189 start_codon:yes stop_codon:yes gene_type:complete